MGPDAWMFAAEGLKTLFSVLGEMAGPSGDQQELTDTQKEFAKLLLKQYESRFANEEAYMPPALNAAFKYAEQVVNRPRAQVYAKGIFEPVIHDRAKIDFGNPQWQSYLDPKFQSSVLKDPSVGPTDPPLPPPTGAPPSGPVVPGDGPILPPAADPGQPPSGPPVQFTPPSSGPTAPIIFKSPQDLYPRTPPGPSNLFPQGTNPALLDRGLGGVKIDPTAGAVTPPVDLGLGGVKFDPLAGTSKMPTLTDLNGVKFDPLSNLKKAINPGQSLNGEKFDPLGNLQKALNPGQSLDGEKFDPLGNLQRSLNPGQSLGGEKFDPLGNFQRALNPGQSLGGEKFDPLGNFQRALNPGQSLEGDKFDPLGKFQKALNPGQSLGGEKFDPLGKFQKALDPGQSLRGEKFDPLGKFQKALNPGEGLGGIKYDPLVNLKVPSLSGGVLNVIGGQNSAAPPIGGTPGADPLTDLVISLNSQGKSVAEISRITGISIPEINAKLGIMPSSGGFIGAGG